MILLNFFSTENKLKKKKEDSREKAGGVGVRVDVYLVLFSSDL